MKSVWISLLGACFFAVVGGRCCLATSDFQPERVSPSDVVEDTPSIGEAELGSMLLRAKYYASSGDVEKAKEAYRAVIEKFPQSGYAHFQLASLLLGAEEIDSRIQYLEKAIELDPKLRDAYESLGLAYRIKEQNEKAIAIYRKAVENIEDNLSFYFSLADAYSYAKKTKEAEEVLQEARGSHPDSPDAWFKLIEFYVSSQQQNKADVAFEKGLVATGNSLRLLRDVRSLYLRWKNEEKAAAVLVETLELYPESPRMWQQLVLYYLAEGQKEKAKQATQKAISSVKYDEDMFTAIARGHMKLSDWDSAIEVLTEATKYHGGSVEIWRTLGSLYEQKQEREKARDCYRKILDMEPTRMQERRLLALSYLAEKNYDRAIEEFLEAIRRFPNDVRLKVDAANAYLASGKFEEGEKIYLDLIKSRPNNPDIQLLLANYYYKSGKPDLMNKTIETAVQIEKDTAKQARIYSLMGQAALEKGDTAIALPLLQEAVKRQPDSASHSYALARAYLLGGEKEKAVEHLQNAVKLAPVPNPDWLLTLGQTYRALRRKDEADGSFSNAIALLQLNCEKNPKNWLFQYQLGQAYETIENDRLAAEAYAECVKLQPENGDLRYKLATVYSGLHQHEKAREQLEKAIELPAGEVKPEWFLLLGEVYHTMTKRAEAGQAFDRGIGILLEKRAEEPQDSHIWAALGEAYSRARKYTDAIEALQKAIELAGQEVDFRLHIALARALDACGNNQAAREQYLKAAALLEKEAEDDPEDSDTHLRLGLVYESARDFARSSQALSKGIELAGGNASYSSYVALADSLDKGGDREAAKAQFEKAYSLLSERIGEHPKDVFAHYMLANVCDKLGKHDECEREYRTTMELDPFFAAAYNNLGYTWIERNHDLEGAIDLVRKALELEPESGAYIDSLGWGYFKQGKLDEALSELKRALNFENTDPTIYDHIGDVYKAKSMITQAIEFWQKALDMNPNDEKIRKKIEENRKHLPPTEANSQPESSG